MDTPPPHTIGLISPCGCVCMCIPGGVFYEGTVMKTTVEAVSVVVFLTISPLDMLLTVDELDLALPPGFLFSTSVSTPPFTDLHALILIHWTGYSNF